MAESDFDEYVVGVGNNFKDVKPYVIWMAALVGASPPSFTYFFGRAIYVMTIDSTNVEIVGKV